MEWVGVGGHSTHAFLNMSSMSARAASGLGSLFFSIEAYPSPGSMPQILTHDEQAGVCKHKKRDRQTHLDTIETARLRDHFIVLLPRLFIRQSLEDMREIAAADSVRI